MDIALVNAVPFALGVAAPLMSTRLQTKVTGGLLAALMALTFVALLGYAPAVSEQGALVTDIGWVPALGLTLSFYLDGLALLFALVVTGVGALVVLYAGYYFDEPAPFGRFVGLLLAFSGAMLGLVLAGNVLTLFITWELTSITSFLLIGFKGKDPKARAGAMQALIVTGGGGLALLVGLLLLGTAAGSMQLQDILSSGDLLRQHPWYTAIALLVMLGCFSKSAQWPLHFWLPDAMSAPTPASAYLHSATMVKAGVYLLARMYPVLGSTPLWTAALIAIGLITMLVGAVWALRQRDLKGCLAFSTVSMLGALVALIGLPEAIGLKAAMVTILAHAMYKGALFLVVGTVDHATGTRNLDELGGLRKTMPGFALVAAASALSMAGVPPLFGFVSKELLLKGMLDGPAALLTLTIVTISAALTVAMAAIIFWDVFMGKYQSPGPEFHHAKGEKQDTHHPVGDDAYDYSHAHSLPPLMIAGPAVLAVGSVIFGFLLDPIITPLVKMAVGPLVNKVEIYLLPSSIDTAFTLSMVALAAGFAVFATRRTWLAWKLPPLPTGPQVYRAVIGRVEAFGDLLLRSQNGRIRNYLAVILAAVIGLIAVGGITTVTSAVQGGQNIRIEFRNASDLLRVLLVLLSLGATLASILFKNHLVAALSLGVAGYSIGGLFLLEPAPDVALVQFLVETVGTVLVILILAKTSDPERRQAMAKLWSQSRRGLLRDVALAAAVGIGVTIFALTAVVNRPSRETIAVWHLENALPQTGVNDVVAAIITDFRGMDTLIEITVFAMAALAVLTILTLPAPGKTLRFLVRPAAIRLQRRRKYETQTGLRVEPGLRPTPALHIESYDPVDEEPDYDTSPESTTPRLSTPLTRIVAQLVLPFALLIAFAQILYAGVGPGDGFTAGVVGGLGVALWYVVFGYNEAKQQLPWLQPARLIGLGLTVALVNALLPLLLGREFLAITLPKELNAILPADIKLSSATIFEIGIFITVLGGVSAVMEAIAHPKEVEKP